MAGSFYPADRSELDLTIRKSFLGKLGPGRYPNLASSATRFVESIIVPHAGYFYSGAIAAHGYLRAADLLGGGKKELVVIILGPNHYGIGSGIALSPNESWTTPLGDIEVNKNLSNEISRRCGFAGFDEVSHSREHSIEVQVPFIQQVFGSSRKISMVPICLKLQDRETMIELADALSESITGHENESKSFLILGSSDLTHYESQEIANSKDLKLLSAVESMDVSKYYSILERDQVSACGYGAIACVMRLSSTIGKEHGTVLKYATSGDVLGDRSSVVGYSAVHFA